jgi:hypothetical protein
MKRCETLRFDGSFECVMTFMQLYKAALNSAEPVEFIVYAPPVTERIGFPNPARAARAALEEAIRMARAHSSPSAQIHVRWPVEDSAHV